MRLMHTADIPLDDLLLDPNNYRIQELSGFELVKEERFHVEQVQKTTLARLQKESLKELRASIIANGFLPIERIVVTPYPHQEGKYLVIEGNRRVAALKSIAEQREGGVEIPAGVQETLKAVPCVVADDSSDFPHFKQTLMGIRHVGGIRPWGGYQRAKLIADLRDDHNLDGQTVAERLGLNVQEVNRRYRAYKALQQMQGNDEFGEYATPALYPLFHEAIAIPGVRDWLGWDGSANKFTSASNVDVFYGLITPYSDEETSTSRPAKLSTYSDVRELKNVMGNSEALTMLLNPDRSLMDALTIARKDELSRKWRSEVSEARTALEKISALEVKRFDTGDIDAIKQLRSVADQVIEIYDTLKS